MTNSISSNVSSVAGLANSVLGSAKQAFKAMADAAVNPSAESPAAVAEAAKRGRRGTVLDRYA
ncbi:hypothetical protein AB0G04_27740 [Actinoplanes sp. NPDC023801]|uniref:hypothetical protein n=1 Tax=Actinoplanes sp. NPDC023801 TaxID=3154595 RepID=UPI003405EEF6